VLVYLVKRVVMSALVGLLIIIMLAGLVHVIPGDPVQIILGPRASPALSQTVRAQMGLDDPIYVQIADFVWGVLRGDLGEDFVTGVPVTTLIEAALPHTVVLAVAGLGFAVLLGVPLGVLAATRPNSLLDRMTAFVSVSFITMPAYVAGLFLLLLFALRWPLFPAVGTGSFSDPLDYVQHLVLPAVALALGWIGYFARLVRTSMLEVLSANYVRTAYAFGIRERLIFYKYALKNALVPTVAVLGVGLGTLLGGAIFVEVIFARNGLGQLVFAAIATRNYPVVQGTALVIALLFVGANLVADLSYRFLDPRIRVEEQSAPA
jgi:peptide/nickel transport system permease protein